MNPEKKLIKKKNKKNLLSSISLWILSGLLIIVIGSALYVVVLLNELPSLDNFNSREVNQSTKLYDRTGQVLLYEIHGEEKRTVIPFEQIPQIIKNATLAAEDSNFYNEPAFDWHAIARAIITDIKSGSLSQGGSTISQQLVKNVFLSSEKTFVRKIKELILAIELESRYSKEEIFSFYLNQIPYGSNAYGVEAASQTYFGKSAKDLSLAEAATLASLPKAPTYYSPWGNHISELSDRKNYVLERMQELKYITKKEYDTATKEKVKYAPPNLGIIKAPHFSLMVKDYLTTRYGENIVMNGGLRVITTLDSSLQDLAERVVEDGVKRNSELYNSKNAALVAEDPKTGQVLALVGSRNYFDTENEGNFNVAAQGLRQPGSALKPFVYMTAFQKGYSPKTIIYDVPTEFDVRDDPQYSYRPLNFDGKFRGPVHMENALAESLNVPAVKTLYLAGFDDVLKNLESFGITTLKERWKYGLSLTLGGGAIKLIELVNAYAMLSQEGVLPTQSLVLEVRDNQGNVLETFNPKNTRVTEPQYPRLINQILSDADLRSPTFQNSLPLTVFPGRDVALKTGTSEDYRDAWAFGYTPSITIGVWAGNNDNTPMQRQGSSILAAVPIWNAFLKEALTKYPAETFTRPDLVPLPQKPMLNGEAEFTPTIKGKVYPQIHSILYYVKRSDPLGDPPEDPTQDQEFPNWEQGVLDWAKTNVPNFYQYNQPLPETVSFSNSGTLTQNSQIDFSIAPIKPANGDFVNSQFPIQADIKSAKGLQQVMILVNHKTMETFTFAPGQTSYHLSYFFNGPVETQNLIEIKAQDASGAKTDTSIIVFH